MYACELLFLILCVHFDIPTKGYTQIYTHIHPKKNSPVAITFGTTTSFPTTPFYFYDYLALKRFLFHVTSYGIHFLHTFIFKHVLRASHINLKAVAFEV